MPLNMAGGSTVPAMVRLLRASSAHRVILDAHQPSPDNGALADTDAADPLFYAPDTAGFGKTV